MKRHLISRIIWTILTIILLAVLAVAIINREWLYDYYRNLSYQPSSEMSKIRDSLKLTDEGTFLFNASQPRLSESTEFNSTCRPNQNTEIAVLGCYTNGDIYVYNITAEELNGIRELTTAHELLHSVYSRLSDQEKSELKNLLDQVYNANIDALSEELNTYPENERQEELYVRAGTEITNLPANLENHYAKYFTNQDLVVGFYNQYIAVFRAIEADMDTLTQEMEAISAEVDTKTAEYEHRANQLNADIISFNACAEVANCFPSEEEFHARRAVLLTEQDALDGLYGEINSLINEYNAKVELYNADVTHSEKLNQLINSSTRVDTTSIQN